MIGHAESKEKRWRRANCFDLVPLHLRCSALIVRVVTQIGALGVALDPALDLEVLDLEALSPVVLSDQGHETRVARPGAQDVHFQMHVQMSQVSAYFTCLSVVPTFRKTSS